MACDITKGRKLPCKDTRTGIKFVDLAPFTDLDFTVSGQEIATLPVALDEVFRYEIKGAGNKHDSTPTVDMEKRTTEFKEVLTLLIQKYTKETAVEVKALLYSRVYAFIHDFNGNVFVYGLTNGLDGTTAPFSSDTNGFTVTLEGMEGDYPPVLSSSAKTALTALVSTSNVTP
jgi:hypothetical protein